MFDLWKILKKKKEKNKKLFSYIWYQKNKYN